MTLFARSGVSQVGPPTHNLFLGGHCARAIENRAHYVRDVTMGEDGNRTRVGSGPQVLTALRNAAISQLRMAGSADIAAALRRNAARVGDLLKSLRILKN